MAVLLLAAVAGLTSFSEAQAQAVKSAQVPDLVWPQPPAKARIKYVGSLRSEDDLVAKKKRSLKEILLRKKVRKPLGIEKPSGVCADSKGRVLVADGQLGLVLVFDRGNKTVSRIGDRGAGKLQGPLDIVVDARDNIYVSDFKRRNVIIFDREGRFISALAREGELKNPVGLGYDVGNERILVADSKAHQVLVYSPKGGLLTKFGEIGDR